jgi:hypothetical protein
MLSKIVNAFIVGGILIAMFVIHVTENSAHARLFCAYNKTFIEFREGKNVWGVIYLDSNGKPVDCANEEKITSELVIL